MKFQKLDPRNSRYYNQRALVYMSNKQWNEAIADLKESLKINPNDKGTRAQFAQVLFEVGEYEEAIKGMYSYAGICIVEENCWLE